MLPSRPYKSRPCLFAGHAGARPLSTRRKLPRFDITAVQFQHYRKACCNALKTERTIHENFLTELAATIDLSGEDFNSLARKAAWDIILALLSSVIKMAATGNGNEIALITLKIAKIWFLSYLLGKFLTFFATLKVLKSTIAITARQIVRHFA